jgi:hypothetical protein
MDYCSLEDAFPQIDNRSIKDKQTAYKVGSKEDKKAAKKKAKKNRSSAAMSMPLEGASPKLDPDRQAFAKFEIVEKFQTSRGAEKSPDLPSHPSLLTEEGISYPGVSTSLKESPSYFGKGLDDTEEGYSSFTNLIGDNPNYLLDPAGLDSAFQTTNASSEMESARKEIRSPVPNTIDVWKTVLPSGTFSSFLTSLPSPPSGPRKEASAIAGEEETDELRSKGHFVKDYTDDHESQELDKDRSALLEKIDDLKRRITELEGRKGQDTQTEILLFVSTGVFLQFALQFAGHFSA